ncbi:hypothetical protein DSO57_1031650 [Entomophthora muscae]|uniref:Uncharacterized protein n=1 Tax=Entomophthora muscae TaxID=34485 RepID=A0ACC2RRN4_9FUNG|nr:hypothetical protein DSO57_1031650 [Entomophthora muscae]
MLAPEKSSQGMFVAIRCLPLAVVVEEESSNEMLASKRLIVKEESSREMLASKKSLSAKALCVFGAYWGIFEESAEEFL